MYQEAIENYLKQHGQTQQVQRELLHFLDLLENAKVRKKDYKTT